MQLLSLLYGTVFLSGSLIDLDGTVFLQLGLFVVAFFILKALVFKPIVALIEAREEAIEGAIEEAKAMTGEAKSAEKEFEAEMQRVRRTAAVERDKLRAEGKKLETRSSTRSATRPPPSSALPKPRSPKRRKKHALTWPPTLRFWRSRSRRSSFKGMSSDAHSHKYLLTRF